MLDVQKLQDDFREYRIRKILNSGELYMFDARITKEKKDEIKEKFEKLCEEKKQSEVTEKSVSKEINENECNFLDNLEKIISLKQ